MEREHGWVDPLKRLIREHEEISEYLEDFEEILGLLYKEGAWNRLKPIESFFERSIISHFEFEERIVFLAILAEIATPEFIKLILELQREHGIILNKLEEFRKLGSKSAVPRDQERYRRLDAIGKSIMDSLLKHAVKEDDKLIPIVEKNLEIFDKYDIT